MNTEKSIKRKECPEHISNGRTKKSQAMRHSDEGGLSPSPPAGCRAYRKALEKVLFDKNVTEGTEGSRVQLLGESGNSSGARPLWNTFESIPPDLVRVPLGILI